MTAPTVATGMPEGERKKRLLLLRENYSVLVRKLEEIIEALLEDLVSSQVLDCEAKTGMMLVGTPKEVAELLLFHLEIMDDAALQTVKSVLKQKYPEVWAALCGEDSAMLYPLVPVVPTVVTKIVLQYSAQELHWFNVLTQALNQWKLHALTSWRRTLSAETRACSVQCIDTYVRACHAIFSGNFNKALTECYLGLQLSPLTKRSTLFQLDFSNLLVLTNLRRGHYHKAMEHQFEAEDLVSSTGAAYAGKAVGWLFVNKANCFIAGMNRDSVADYVTRVGHASDSFEKAIRCFKLDTSTDGEYGYNYTVARLAILHLHCGPFGQWMDYMIPDRVQFSPARVESFLRDIQHGLNNRMLEVQYLIARCDLAYRSGQITSALRRAVDAMRIAVEMGLIHENKMINGRIRFLTSRRVQYVTSHGTNSYSKPPAQPSTGSHSFYLTS